MSLKRERERKGHTNTYKQRQRDCETERQMEDWREKIYKSERTRPDQISTNISDIQYLENRRSKQRDGGASESFKRKDWK